MKIDGDACLRCGACVGVCPENCLRLDSEVLRDDAKCSGCLQCLRFCPVGAIKG